MMLLDDADGLPDDVLLLVMMMTALLCCVFAACHPPLNSWPFHAA